MDCAPADVRYTLQNGFRFFFFDLDTGLDGQLAESFEVCGEVFYQTSETFRNYSIPTSVSVSPSLPNAEGEPCVEFRATREFSGANNPTFQSEIFAASADELSEYSRVNVLPFVIALEYPAGLSSFKVKYSISAAGDVGTSGRNFLFTGEGDAAFCTPKHMLLQYFT
eukprot:2795707-Pleurochrysis_carterae.AAC.2